MVYITHSGENSEKLNAILNAARKRFAVYGLEKTTMKEIASDLQMSKATLYYYFPDKENLFKTVVEVEQEEFFKMLDEMMQNAPDAIVMLREYNRIRLTYYQTFFNLNRLKYEEYRSIKPLLNDVISTFRCRENKLIEDIIRSGRNSGIFFCEDVSETASLFIEILKGIRMQLIHNKEFMYIEKEEYIRVYKRE
jgi:AcrR family transcriptional regulator